VVAGSVGAVSTPRDQPADTSPLVRVFVDETLDVSAVELTGGGTVGTGSVTLVGDAGDADGEVRTIDDPTDADFGGFATGTYFVSGDSDERPEFVVTEPQVTDVVIENQNGANVTNGWEPTGESLTVTARYNFAEADRLDLTVRDPDGLGVTASVASSDRITTDGGTVQLDLSEQDEGTFRIILEGSDLDDARQVVTVRTGPRRTATPLPATPTATETPTTEQPPTETPRPTTRTDTPTDRPATPTATETQPITPSPTAAPTTQPATPTATGTETSTPGFGVVTVVAALLAAAAAGRMWRR
jgi:PGF-CTERM protein